MQRCYQTQPDPVPSRQGGLILALVFVGYYLCGPLCLIPHPEPVCHGRLYLGQITLLEVVRARAQDALQTPGQTEERLYVSAGLEMPGLPWRSRLKLLSRGGVYASLAPATQTQVSRWKINGWTESNDSSCYFNVSSRPVRTFTLSGSPPANAEDLCPKAKMLPCILFQRPTGCATVPETCATPGLRLLARAS